MIKKCGICLFIITCMLFTGVSTVVAEDDVDILLIEKLVEKNILTQGEAKVFIDKIRKLATKEVTKSTSADTKKTAAIPKWASKMKLKGDIRLRYESKDLEPGSETKRGRVRFRLGVETDVNDKIKAGFGLATGKSGSGSQRSTNQTLGDTFSTKSLNLDYAYVKYTLSKSFSIQGGKFKNPLFQPGDLLWDTDIMPEGISAKFKWNLAKGFDLTFVPAFFYIDDRGGSNDPNMWILEPAISWEITDKVKLRTSATYYAFSKIQGQGALDDSEGTNTFDDDGLYTYDYDSIAFAADLAFSDLGIVPYLAVFGQYVNNTDPNNDNKGHLFGIKFGDKKVKKFGQWQFKYIYRKLEKDAWLDSFPDADAFGGGDTNAKGSEYVFKYGLDKNWSLALDYYDSERLDINAKENVFQVDLNYKF